MTRPILVQNFLAAPRGPAAIVADALRVIGLLSVVVAGIVWQITDAGILALALPALLVPRFLGARAGLDIANAVVVLVAAWSNVIDLYRTIPWWDIVVHIACTGVLAAIAYLGLALLGVLPRRGAPGFGTSTAIIVTTALGLAFSAVWEMIEWLGKTFVTDEIFVTYDDTIGDMAAGGLGALVAGIVVARVRLTRDR